MTTDTIPEELRGFPILSFEDIHFIYYNSPGGHFKTRFIFNANPSSFCFYRVKEIYPFRNKMMLQSNAVTIETEKDSFIGELKLQGESDCSLLVLFPGYRVFDFLTKVGIPYPNKSTVRQEIKIQQSRYLGT